ncbi:dnaJ homolog subfamily C member 30, mitochondrial isoform X2 [Diachasma alloeum]|uniref:dnaJ homolog subfamily C member 30, mitochondrial isoform X2 n=1 Tax=Diachasma alloeum TaxID=454923 RepID=UPI00073835D2|nr:dnaJ homolog subfamily C member 30, mitochondrial isoform X2 [Diachasma alloeum]
MNCRTRILSSSSVLTRGLASRVKRKNHYDSLEVDSKATQGEIKSAYFKLTMQYHPDKNSSEAAKVKFRDIAEAYEVLGNYQKRKQYDRGMQIKVDQGQETRRSEGYKPQDIEKEASRVRSAIHRHSSEVPGGGKMYDFDRWTKEHYGTTFKKTWVTKEEVKRSQKQKDAITSEQNLHATEKLLLTLILCLLGVIMGLITSSNTFDIPVAGDGEKRTEGGT